MPQQAQQQDRNGDYQQQAIHRAARFVQLIESGEVVGHVTLFVFKDGAMGLSSGGALSVAPRSVQNLAQYLSRIAN
jgi:hypothetical protein